MKLGVVLRNMGELSTAPILSRVAGAAEAAGLDGVWVTDHLAIPPGEAEGSNGRYLDPLATLAYLAAATRRIHLGTAVLIAPYRPPLPVAKWVATIQELSGERLELGVGVGWMAAEFRALGIERAHRGRDTDRFLELLHRCFAADEVTGNGQTFLFRPRPARPPVLIGGRGTHALDRTIRYGDGWLPVRASPETLAGARRELSERAEAAERECPTIQVMTSLPVDDRAALEDEIARYREAGASGLIHAGRAADEAACLRAVSALAEVR